MGNKGQAIEIKRAFEAPRRLVYAAWTEPERVMHWWGPNGFTTPVAKMDVRPGGAWHNCMRSPEGRDYWSRGVYREVVPPERIVSTDSFSDEAGNIVKPTQYGMSPDWPEQAELTVTFAESAGRTTLSLRHDVGAAPAAEREQCEAGWSESLDRLAAYLTMTKQEGRA